MARKIQEGANGVEGVEATLWQVGLELLLSFLQVLCKIVRETDYIPSPNLFVLLSILIG